MYQDKKPNTLEQKMEVIARTFAMLGTFPDCDSSLFLKKVPKQCELEKTDIYNRTECILHNYWRWLDSKLVYEKSEYVRDGKMLLYCDCCIIKDLILMMSWLADNFNFTPFKKMVDFFGEYAKFLNLIE